MSETSLIGLPYLEAAQAQKHVTHNEALRRLDGLVHLAAITRAVKVPPAAPADTARYLIPADATGDWAGRGGQIAILQDGAWSYLAPRAGWRLWLIEEARLMVFTDQGWREAAPVPDRLARLGINTAADDANLLAVAAANVLFTHQGGDQRLKINKANASATASLLLQQNWSGRAEIGLAGDDQLRIKTSTDGAAWREAITISGQGAVAFPAGFAAGQTFPAAAATVTLDFGAAPLQSLITTLDLAGADPAHKVIATASLTPSAGVTADAVEKSPLVIAAAVPAAGKLRISAYALGAAITGKRFISILLAR